MPRADEQGMKIVIGIHRRFAFYWLDEAGLAVLQIGWLIVELDHEGLCVAC